MDPLANDVCAICIEVPINPFTLPCGHVFCYMCLKRVAEDDKPCPLCNAVIPEFVLEGAKVSEEVINLKETAGKWMYNGRHSGWWYYSPDDDKAIEKAWKVHKKLQNMKMMGSLGTGNVSITINILGREYKIDFENMTQSSNGVFRNIKRVETFGEEDCVVKGISGLQIVKKENVPNMPKPVWTDPDEYVFVPGAWVDDSEDETSSNEDEASSNEASLDEDIEAGLDIDYENLSDID